MPKNEVRIYNSKAVIYQNDYDVWQFRIWLADENKYFRQSLRTKDKAKAISDAEEMFEDVRYMKRKGRKVYSDLLPWKVLDFRLVCFSTKETDDEEEPI